MSSQNEPLPVSGVLGRRPWLPAAVFLAALLVALAAAVLLLANVSCSGYRFLPDFPDRLIVSLDTVAAWLMWWVVPAAAVVMLVMPVVLLFPRRHRKTGVRMLVAALCALPVGLMLFGAVLVVGMMSLATDQTGIARENLASRAEARRVGRPDFVRKAIPRLRQVMWTFGDGRYCMYRHGDNPERFWLVDEKHEFVANGGVWRDRVLLKDVVRWEERRGVLSVEMLDGGSYELEYATGRLVGRHGKAVEGK